MYEIDAVFFYISKKLKPLGLFSISIWHPPITRRENFLCSSTLTNTEKCKIQLLLELCNKTKRESLKGFRSSRFPRVFYKIDFLKS